MRRREGDVAHPLERRRHAADGHIEAAAEEVVDQRRPRRRHEAQLGAQLVGEPAREVDVAADRRAAARPRERRVVERAADAKHARASDDVEHRLGLRRGELRLVVVVAASSGTRMTSAALIKCHTLSCGCRRRSQRRRARRRIFRVCPAGKDAAASEGRSRAGESDLVATSSFDFRFFFFGDAPRRASATRSQGQRVALRRRPEAAGAPAPRQLPARLASLLPPTLPRRAATRQRSLAAGGGAQLWARRRHRISTAATSTAVRRNSTRRSLAAARRAPAPRNQRRALRRALDAHRDRALAARLRKLPSRPALALPPPRVLYSETFSGLPPGTWSGDARARAARAAPRRARAHAAHRRARCTKSSSAVGHVRGAARRPVALRGRRHPPEPSGCGAAGDGGGREAAPLLARASIRRVAQAGVIVITFAV